MVVSHDRWFLDRIATHILAWEGEDEDGVPHWFWFEGNFADYEANKIERLGPEPRGRTHPSIVGLPATERSA
ncbi:ABC transporter ATP-binding protein [Cutibacterium acnes JCM 18920]|nr:ABC transporter ATP-binding protein [Cutibacterium acnes JCM 18920]